MTNNEQKQPPKAAGKDPYEDRRKFLRVDAPLKGRFLTESGDERPCLVVNISVGGALIRAKRLPREGEKVVLYIDQVGRFESRVIRAGESSFAVTYERKRDKNTRTADNLIKAVNLGQRSTNRRKAPRIEQNAPAIVQLEDGRTQKCAILDISLTGASIEINPRPPLGTILVLGRMTAKVVRRHEKGIGVVFTGSSDRMEEVIEETTVVEATDESGAPLATAFGKKGLGA